jgi:hypothetical protein
MLAFSGKAFPTISVVTVITHSFSKMFKVRVSASCDNSRLPATLTTKLEVVHLVARCFLLLFLLRNLFRISSLDGSFMLNDLLFIFRFNVLLVYVAIFLSQNFGCLLVSLDIRCAHKMILRLLTVHLTDSRRPCLE